MAISFREHDLQESPEDCEDPELAEVVRDFLQKQSLQIFVVDPSSTSGSGSGAEQSAALVAATSAVAPSQLFHVVSEAASQSSHASDARNSDSSAWLEAYEEKLRERSQRVAESES